MDAPSDRRALLLPSPHARPPLPHGRPGAGEAAGAPSRGRRRAKPAAAGEALTRDPLVQPVFDALRAHRLALARELDVPPFMIASDRTLRELAAERPRTPEDLLGIYGIGEAKAERFGKGFLEVIASLEQT